MLVVADSVGTDNHCQWAGDFVGTVVALREDQEKNCLKEEGIDIYLEFEEKNGQSGRMTSVQLYFVGEFLAVIFLRIFFKFSM